jgi:hypothetical protein
MKGIHPEQKLSHCRQRVLGPFGCAGEYSFELAAVRERGGMPSENNARHGRSYGYFDLNLTAVCTRVTSCSRINGFAI